jgi:hypothetical protein
VFGLALSECNTKKATRKEPHESGDPDAWSKSVNDNAKDLLEKGKAVFRFETFGDEIFWTDKLQLHKVLVSEKHGGIGNGLAPKDALAAGIKVDLRMPHEFFKAKNKRRKISR